MDEVAGPACHSPGRGPDRSGAAVIADGGLATELSAAIGVGVGAIIRNQAGAIIIVLALLTGAALLKRRDITS